MKQHVSVNQIKSLTVEEQKALRDLWEPLEGDLVYFSSTMIYFITRIARYSPKVTEYHLFSRNGFSVGGLSKNDILPILTIGQMFEILIDYNHDKDLKIWNPLIIDDIEESKMGFAVNFNRKKYVDYELVDALWMAVKEILGRNK